MAKFLTFHAADIANLESNKIWVNSKVTMYKFCMYVQKLDPSTFHCNSAMTVHRWTLHSCAPLIAMSTAIFRKWWSKKGIAIDCTGMNSRSTSCPKCRRFRFVRWWNVRYLSGVIGVGTMYSTDPTRTFCWNLIKSRKIMRRIEVQNPDFSSSDTRVLPKYQSPVFLCLEHFRWKQV